MNLTYALADLHGASDLLDLALGAIHEHATATPAGSRTVVFLGDYVDRGPGSRQIVERLVAGPSDGWRWVCLKGNHEDMMAQAIGHTSRWDWWIGNGGATTLASYDPDFPVLERHLVWTEALPLFHADQHRVFVHAGVDPTLSLDQQPERALLWSRDSNALGHGGRFVVHGHTPCPDGPAQDGQSINLDTLAWKAGRLVVGVFDDERAGGPVDFVEVRRGLSV